jgi:hypothetical protein
MADLDIEICPFCKQKVSPEQLKHINEQIEKMTREEKKIFEEEFKRKYESEQENEIKGMRAEREKLKRDQEKLVNEQKKLDEKVRQKLDKNKLEFEQKMLRYKRDNKSLQKNIEKLQRQINKQTPDELGGMSEDQLYQKLINEFAKYGDIIEPISKRHGGADFIQKVFYNGKECGKILFENKNTVNWDNDWIRKIKEDMVNQNTKYALLVTNVFPKNEKNFTCIDGVHVVHYSIVSFLVNILREALIDLQKQSLSGIEMDEKMAELYNYLKGDDFKNKINIVHESIKNLNDMRESEVKAHNNLWLRERSETDKISTNISNAINKVWYTLEKEPILVQPIEKKKRKMIIS